MNTTNNEEWETRLQDKINNLEFGLPEAFFHEPIKDFIRSERSSVRRETEQKIRKFLEESSVWSADYIYLRKALMLQQFDEKFTNLDTISHE